MACSDPGRQADLGFEFGDRVADPRRRPLQERRRRRRGHGLLLRVAVDDQIRGVVLVVQRELPDAAGVHVLGDIALTAPVDEDAADRLLRVDQERHLGGVHVGQVGAERLGHPDGLPVMLLDRRGRAARQPRRVLRHHRVVVGEAARREHDAAARANRHRLAVLTGDAGRRRGRRTRTINDVTRTSYTARTPSDVAVSTSGFISM